MRDCKKSLPSEKGLIKLQLHYYQTERIHTGQRDFLQTEVVPIIGFYLIYDALVNEFLIINEVISYKPHIKDLFIQGQPYNLTTDVINSISQYDHFIELHPLHCDHDQVQ